jgi:hypothetical protein
MVPTHDLAESRKARGEDVSREGYMGGRLNDANDDELLPATFATQQETGASEQPTPTPATQMPAMPDLSVLPTFNEDFRANIDYLKSVQSGTRGGRTERVPSVREGIVCSRGREHRVVPARSLQYYD